MLLTAQYSNHMRIGQGFNSYTHETRVDNAVRVGNSNGQSFSAKNSWRDSGISMLPEETPCLLAPNGPSTSPKAAGQAASSPVKRANSKSNPSASQTSTKPAARTSTETPPYHILRPQVWDSNQSVTYSSWQIDNISEIADSLNVSAYALVKYATVEANANTAMIHESTLHDSQLNYMVSVKVTNESPSEQESMEFQPIEAIPPQRFTQVYGDCFISDFLEGGEFQAVISIKVNDKSKLREVKQAVDFQLSVPPVPGLDVGGGGKFATGSNEVFKNTQTTISVRCNGGGVIKEPRAKWTLDTVIQVANAFPCLVASCPSKTSAILTRYTALRSFQDWKWKMYRDLSWTDFIAQDDHWENRLILSYAPCKVYTAALFDDLMSFKAMNRHIKHMMDNPSEYRERARIPKSAAKLLPADTGVTPSSAAPTSPETPRNVKALPRIEPERKVSRGATFGLNDPDNPASWALDEIDAARGPLPMDIHSLKKAALVCRASLTLITEEAARLVDHPHLAYAEFDDQSHRILINRPNYPAPELLEQRLPVFVGDDASGDVMSNDEAVIHTLQHQRSDELYFAIVGDLPNPHRHYKAFSTLDISEPYMRGSRKGENRIARVSLHAYHHSAWRVSRFSRDSHMAISAIGFKFVKSTTAKPIPLRNDKCNVHVGGRPNSDERFIMAQDLQIKEGGDIEGIQRIEIAYVPGSGRIAALTFFEGCGGAVDASKSLPTLCWKQWERDESNGREPDGLKRVVQGPPTDGDRWRFVGLCGHWDSSVLGGCVLARVSGIWRRVSES